MAARNGCWVSYSRRPNWYTGRKRYYGPDYGYGPILAAVDMLWEAALIDNQLVAPGSTDLYAAGCERRRCSWR